MLLTCNKTFRNCWTTTTQRTIKNNPFTFIRDKSHVKPHFPTSTQTRSASTYEIVERIPFIPLPHQIILDARSPSEFQEDHIPNAINLPVLDDIQRHQVGLLYKQDSLQAKLLGARFICENIAKSLENIHNYVSFKNELFVYCARGGQRSQSLAEVLARVGFRVKVLKNGHKSYRKHVIEGIQSMANSFHQVIMLQGVTGSGKTLLLEQIKAVLSEHNFIYKGVQFAVLDIEDAAQHYGSILGEREMHQHMTQKTFETRILKQLAEQLHTAQQSVLKFAPSYDILAGGIESPPNGMKRILFVESESAHIGKFQVPKAIWDRMKSGTIYTIEQQLENRIQYIRQQYRHFEEEQLDKLKKALTILNRVVDGAGTMKSSPLFVPWQELIEERRFDDLVKQLIQMHYDIVYRKSRSHLMNSEEQAGATQFQLSGTIEPGYYREVAVEILNYTAEKQISDAQKIV